MSKAIHHRSLSGLPLVLPIVIALTLAMVGTAWAAPPPFTSAPGYPIYGCYDTVTAGVGMWAGESFQIQDLNVPGPVVDAYLVWMGTEDGGAAGAPNKSDLVFNGTSVIGDKVGQQERGPNDPDWYMWRANIGPKGYNLVKQGAQKFTITGWGPGAITPPFLQRNGASVVVVYNTGACARPNKIDLFINDLAYIKDSWTEGLTGPMAISFPPAPNDRETTVWLSFAGTDQKNLTYLVCRPHNLWAATGTGAAPATIVQYGQPSIGLNGGKLAVVGPFWQDGCGTTFAAPVTELLGWQYQFGPKPNTGGYINPEWAVTRVKVRIPAGHTWLVLQGEAVRVGGADPTLLGESGGLICNAATPLYNPELKVTKTDGVTLANPGDTITYTISYDNHGYGPADNVTIVDTLPPRMTFVSATNGGTYDPATRKVTWNLGTVNFGVNGQVKVVAKLDPVFPAGTTTLTNQVAISTTTPGELDTSDNSATDVTNVFAKVELAIVKTATPEPVDAGAPLTYTIAWTVGGNAFAPGVTIVDTLPPTVTFVSASNGGVYDPATRRVTWTLGEVTPVKTGSYTINVLVKTPLYNGTKLPNSVVIADTIGDSKSSAIQSTVRSSHLLAVSKTDAPDPVDAGGDLTYTINWSVTGNEPARDAKIVDTLPAQVTFVSATGGGVHDPVARTITWNLGELMTPQSGSFSVAVKVKTPLYNGAKLTNMVHFSDTTPGSTPAHAEVETTVRSSHLLAVSKSDDPDPVDAGGVLTYTINWSSTGNEPARDAKVVDTLTPYVTFVSATGGVYDPAARTITWNLGEVMTPQSGSFTVVLNVATPLYNGTVLPNTVTLSDTTPGSTPATAAINTTVRSDHVLNISKTAAPEPVEKGQQLTFTINWSVTGNEPADNTVIVDQVPFGVRFVSATGGGVFDPVAGTITWNLGNLVTPQSGSVSFVGTVNKDFPNGLDITNRVTISDYKPGKEKTATTVTTVVQTPEGSIGDTVWYDANNNGIQEPGEPGIPNVGLLLYRAGPDNLCNTADDVAVGNAATNSAGKYLFDALAAGKYCVKVIDATVPVGLVLTHAPTQPINLAEGQNYRDADFGYGPLTGTGVIGDRVWSDADGDGVQDPGEVGIGNVTLNLLSAGPDGRCNTADDVVVGTKTTAADGSYPYLFTGVAPGRYCVRVTDTNNVLTGLTLTGGVNPHGLITLAAGGAYLNADFGYRGTTNYVGRIGDLVFYDGNRNGVYEPGPIERGVGGVTLNLVAPGPDNVFGTADDAVIASTTTDANGAYLFSGLPDGQYQVIVTDLAGRLVGYTQTYGVPNANNNGQASPYTATIVGGNSVLTADFGYADGHLLYIIKMNNVPAGQPVEAGAEMIYTLSYGASGREPAPNVVIRDPLPLQVNFVSASNGGIYDPATRTVTWSLGNLNPGDTGTRTVTVRVKKPLTNMSYIFNTAIISDDARVIDEDTDVVQVHAEPILSLTKENTPTGTVKPGDTIQYKLCYANTGNGNATSVALVDTIPQRTTYVDGSATGGPTYDAVNRRLTWNLGTVAPDASACVYFSVRVDMTIPGVTEVNQGWTVDNVATLSSAELPTITRTTSNPLNAFVKPTLTKAVSPTGEVLPGANLRYTLCYANQGTANLTGVTLSDSIPQYTQYVDGSATGGASYDAANRKLTWNIGVLGPTAAPVCITFDVTIPLTVEGLTGQARALSFSEWNTILNIVNTATLKTDQVPDKTATATNTLNAVVDPAIYKTVDSPIRHMGETVVFTVTVTNRGTANANDVVITEPIDPKLEGATLTTSKGTASYNTATRVWTVNVGLLAPGETVTIVVTGKTARIADKDLPYQIGNTATVAFREGIARNSNRATVDVVYFFPGEIPEASTLLLLGSGLAGLAGYAQMRIRSRRRKV